jgi:hypothetical protein
MNFLQYFIVAVFVFLIAWLSFFFYYIATKEKLTWHTMCGDIQTKKILIQKEGFPILFVDDTLAVKKPFAIFSSGEIKANKNTVCIISVSK